MSHHRYCPECGHETEQTLFERCERKDPETSRRCTGTIAFVPPPELSEVRLSESSVKITEMVQVADEDMRVVEVPKKDEPPETLLHHGKPISGPGCTEDPNTAPSGIDMTYVDLDRIRPTHPPLPFECEHLPPLAIGRAGYLSGIPADEVGLAAVAAVRLIVARDGARAAHAWTQAVLEALSAPGLRADVPHQGWSARLLPPREPLQKAPAPPAEEPKTG